MLNEKQISLFLLAIENLQKPIGDWTDSAIIDHLKTNRDLAANYLLQVVDEQDNVNEKGLSKNGPQVFATIHPVSHYASQCNGDAFPVKFEPDTDGYHWRGGIGGRYRLSDLSLHIKNDQGEAVAIPIFNAHEDLQLLERILAPYEQRAKKGDQDPEWITKWTTELIQRLETLEKTTHDNYVEYEE
ncbi:MAG: hypothetical protein AXW15_00020 [Neptuniibacter sp. Phe_28]|nr:MAG: hypothetical protein AXW15_00020 [Neptuniibacter sp. Phe_28]